MDGTVVACCAHEAGELHAYARLIEQYTTHRGLPRMDLVAQARRKFEWLSAMMLSIESDLQTLEGPSSHARQNDRRAEQATEHT